MKDLGKAGFESHRPELPSRTTRLIRFLALSISWMNYDDVYQVWKEYRRGKIERHQALQIIDDKYGVCLFFLLYPLHKIVRLFQRPLVRILIGRPSIRTFDPSKKTMLLVSHEASQTAAPLLAFNLLEKFAVRYNVISVLLGPGDLENAFKNVSSVTIGPFPKELRLTRHIHASILHACSRFAPAFAVVNSIESREALVTLSKAGVPCVLLVHEFVSRTQHLDEMPTVVISADQIIFPARLVWEDAVEVFPLLAERPANIIEQLGTDDCYYQAAKTSIRDLALSAFDMDRYAARLEQAAERGILMRMQEEVDFATISRSDAFLMEYAAPPGLSWPRDRYVKHFVRLESTHSLGRRCPFPGFHPGMYRNANPELNDPPFVNPFAHYLRNGQPQGPWLLDIIRPEHPTPVHNPPGPPTALHLHIYYPDLTSEMLHSLTANHQTTPDLFVTVSSDDALREVAETAAKLCVSIKDIMVVPNRGRDVGPLLTLFGRRFIKDYEIVGHLHSKRSLQAKRMSPGLESLGEAWRTFCFENLLGGKYAMMDFILGRFARNPKLGLVFPCDPRINGWTYNRRPAEALLERMGIAAKLPEDFFFPVGTMFWARTDAIAPLIELDLGWNDYPPEPLPLDGTILHAIERLFPVVAQRRGFEIAGTYVPGVSR